jgi:hypothetical protein
LSKVEMPAWNNVEMPALSKVEMSNEKSDSTFEFQASSFELPALFCLNRIFHNFFIHIYIFTMSLKREPYPCKSSWIYNPN